jgi:hypothetical protein
MHRDPFPFHHKSFLIDQMPRYTSLGGPNAPLEQAVFHKRVWADDHGSLGKGLTTTCNIQENVLDLQGRYHVMFASLSLVALTAWLFAYIYASLARRSSDSSSSLHSTPICFFRMIKFCSSDGHLFSP